MFIPATGLAEPKINDKIILNEDIIVNKGTFTKGHKFKLIDDCRGYFLKDKDGNTLSLNFNQRSCFEIIKQWRFL